MLRKHFRFLNYLPDDAGLIRWEKAPLWTFDTSLRHKGTTVRRPAERRLASGWYGWAQVGVILVSGEQVQGSAPRASIEGKKKPPKDAVLMKKPP
jgi:hypothetical protein